MRTIFVLLFGLFLFLAPTSCTPERLTDTDVDQYEELTVDPPTEVPGEEEELDPDN